MITYGANYFPMWQRGGLCFHENGGRKSYECLDMTLVVWKFTLNLTIWNLGKVAPFMRFLPRHKSGRGYCIGLLPVGAKP